MTKERNERKKENGMGVGVEEPAIFFKKESYSEKVFEYTEINPF